MKKTISLILCFVLALTLFSACSSPSVEPTAPEAEETPAVEEPVVEEPTAEETPEEEAEVEEAPAATSSPIVSSEGAGTGTGTATAKKIGFGGYIEVTVTVEDGKITDVQVVGDDETSGIGSRAVETLPAEILAKGDFGVDAVAGATVSSNAILEAGQLAYNEIMGN